MEIFALQTWEVLRGVLIGVIGVGFWLVGFVVFYLWWKYNDNEEDEEMAETDTAVEEGYEK